MRETMPSNLLPLAEIDKQTDSGSPAPLRPLPTVNAGECPTEPATSLGAGSSLLRILWIARKELWHMYRDPLTLFVAIALPLGQMFLLGHAVDMNVRRVPTMLLDQARTQESRDLLYQLENTGDFRIVGTVDTEAELASSLVRGNAQAGIRIPADFSRRRQAGLPATFLVLVDGSDSAVAAELVNVSHAVALRESLLDLGQRQQLPVEARPRVLFNPDTRSSNFFIPGLIVLLTYTTAIVLSAGTIVREREGGTLEHMLMTPIHPAELLLGKLCPYLGLTTLQFFAQVWLMHVAFDVPIRGDLLAAFVCLIPYLLSTLALGCLISSLVSTHLAAMQLASGTLVPVIFLSGYIFPLNSMPVVFASLARLIPSTWMIDATRAATIRGAAFADLRLHMGALAGLAALSILFSLLTLRRTRA